MEQRSASAAVIEHEEVALKIAGALCWERGRPARTERVSAKRWFPIDIFT